MSIIIPQLSTPPRLNNDEIVVYPVGSKLSDLASRLLFASFHRRPREYPALEPCSARSEPVIPKRTTCSSRKEVIDTFDGKKQVIKECLVVEEL